MEEDGLGLLRTESIGEVGAAKPPAIELAGNRYVLLDPVGEGGMAVVYTAYDRKLDRKIAIKLVRGSVRDVAEGRLLREAQALARLKHPNVVTVHDAGTFEDRVFVAMELVEGQSLRGWLGEEPRTWREVLAPFLAAGRGLAAAHAAGLVHRDFKPDNVLVGRDGTIRVADFGLARLAGDAIDPSLPEAPSPLAFDLTRTGAIVGTPRYMPPEQHVGATVDARGDQFAFCVALYEGVYRQKPFAGDSLEELRESVSAGQVAEPPRGAHVPAWLAAAVRRGLRAAPEERWPSMDALLAELGRDRGKTRRRLLAAAGVAAVAALVVVPLASRRSAAAACVADPTKLAGVWDDAGRAALHRSFLAAKLPNAEDLYQRVSARLDAYASATVALRKQICEATAVRHEQSETLLDLRMACLDRGLGELRAFAQVLAAPENVNRGALGATDKLRPIGECAETDIQTGAAPLPPVALRPAVQQAQQMLDHVQALAYTGNFKAGIQELPPLVAEARRLGFAPLVGEAYYASAVLQQDKDPHASEAALREVLLAAAESRYDHLTARAGMLLVYVIGAKQHRTAEALAMVPFVDGAIRRVGDPPHMKGAFLSYVGYVQLKASKYAEARAAFEAGLPILEQGKNVNPTEVGRILTDLMQVAAKLERAEEAEQWGRRALDILEKAYGPSSFDVAVVVNELGGIAMARHDTDGARRYYEQASAILELQHGPRSSSAAVMQENLGDVAVAQGRLDDALAAYQRELSIMTENLGPDQPASGRAAMKVGEAFLLKGNLDEARPRLEGALALLEKKLGPDHDEVADALIAVAHLRLAEHAPDQATPLLVRALAIQEAALGAGSDPVRHCQLDLGDAYLAARHGADAVKTFERAVAGIAAGTPAVDAAAARFGLARALRATGGDAARAKDLARQAKTGWDSVGEKTQSRVVDAWLAAP